MDYEHLKYIEMDKRIRCSWSDTNNNQCERAGIRDGLCLYHFNNLKYIEMDTKQKELWEIARDAYLSKTSTAHQDWKAATREVIAEHERRKAEPVKPASYNGPPQSMTAQQVSLTTAMTGLVKPDPFAIEKAAFAAGKTIQFYSQSCSEWLDCNPSPPSWYPDFEYRVKPDPNTACKQALEQGKRIQRSMPNGQWATAATPQWYPHIEYRVHPDDVDPTPEWKLPDPPDGTEWHRTDWTAEMLPDGYRPLLLGENEERNDEFLWEDKKWAKHPATGGARANDYHRRTTRPLPVKPEPFDAEKAAFTAGKTIQFRRIGRSDAWRDALRPDWSNLDFEYRVKPDPFQVELGPDDVPPGSTLATDMGGWMMITSVGMAGVVCAAHSTGCIKWDELKRRFKINRNDGNGWVPCSKIKPE